MPERLLIVFPSLCSVSLSFSGKLSIDCIFTFKDDWNIQARRARVVIARPQVSTLRSKPVKSYYVRVSTGVKDSTLHWKMTERDTFKNNTVKITINLRDVVKVQQRKRNICIQNWRIAFLKRSEEIRKYETVTSMILNHVYYYRKNREKILIQNNDYAISFRFTNVSIFMRKGNYKISMHE